MMPQKKIEIKVVNKEAMQRFLIRTLSDKDKYGERIKL